ARLPLEVLDDVRDVGVAAVDPGVLEGAVEELPGRADERPAGEVLLVAGLLADEHQAGRLAPLAEDGLGRSLPEVAALAGGGCLAQPLERRRLRHVSRSGLGLASGGHGLRMAVRAVA